MQACTHKSTDPKAINCCHCCDKCFPSLEVEPGKCAICPIFGRECNYGLEPETDNLVLSQLSRSSLEKNMRTRPHSQYTTTQKKAAVHLPGDLINSRLQPRNSAVGVLNVSQVSYCIPVIPVQMVQAQPLAGSQVFFNMQLPVLEMMQPKLASSTMMIPSETHIHSKSQVHESRSIHNPERSSPIKNSKLKLSLVSTKKGSEASPLRKIESSMQEI